MRVILLTVLLALLAAPAFGQTDFGDKECTIDGVRLMTIEDQTDATDPFADVTLRWRDDFLGVVFRANYTSITGTNPTAQLLIQSIGPDGVVGDTITTSGNSTTTAEDVWVGWSGDAALAFGAGGGLGDVQSDRNSPVFRKFRAVVQVGGTITDLDATIDCWLVK